MKTKQIGKVGDDRYTLEGGKVAIEDDMGEAYGHKEEDFEN